MTTKDTLIESLGPVSELTIIAPKVSFDPNLLAGFGLRKVRLPIREAIGRALALSNTHNGYEDVFFIDKNTLFVSLTKATYNKAGLELTYDCRSSKYVGSFDLNNAPARLTWALKNTLTADYQWLVSDDMPTVSLSARSILVPSLGPPSEFRVNSAELEDWANELSEWIGLMALGSAILDISTKREPYICDYHLDGTPDTVQLTTIRGMLTPEVVRSLWQSLDCSWAIISAKGFSNCPRMWGCNHRFLSSGDGAYSLVRHTDKTITAFQYVAWGDL